MTALETTIFWIAMFVYISCFCLHLFGFISRKERALVWSSRLLWLALICHTAVGVVRWIAGGHPPVTDTYELNLTGTWFTILIFLMFKKLGKADQAIALLVVPVTFVLLGYGVMEYTEVTPMGPAFQSPWLIVHVIFAWLAFGSYAIATGASAIQLKKIKDPDWKPNLPNADALDISSYRFIVLGFINHSIMLVSGAIWAKKLWGHYWSWDPLETWSLIAFLYYAFCLHARSFFGWKGKRAAWLTLLGLVILIVSFWGVRFISPSPHPGP